MSFFGKVILLLLIFILGGCAAAQPPLHRDDALAALGRVQQTGAADLFPLEVRSTLEAFARGESSLQLGEYEDAERYYFLTLQKGALLEQEIRKEQARIQEAARLAEEEKKAELARRAQEEMLRLAHAKAKSEAEALAKKEAAEAERSKVKPPKEHPLVSYYTVKRGESLPLIASQPQVYGDRNLWPLVYRGNRDQISDPRHIWPGQVLRIPRNVGRDDIAEARRYAQERVLR